MQFIINGYKKWRENSRVFLFYFNKYRSYYVFGIASLVIVDGLEVVPPLLLKTAVDEITTPTPGNDLHWFLTKIVLAYMAVALVQGFMRFLWRRYIIRTSMYASNDMRNELFIHLSSMAPGFFRKKRVGDLVSLSTNDIEAIRFSLGPGALIFFDALFYFLAIPPIMFWVSPQLTLISFLPLLLVPFFVRKMESAIQKHFRAVQDKFSHLASHCQEALGGIRIIKGSSLENFKETEFAQFGEEYKDANLRSVRTQATLTAGLEAILSTSSSILFLLGGAFVIGDKISLGMFVAFQRYIQKMSWPMEAFGLAANIFQRSLASQKRLDEVLQEKPSIVDAIGTTNTMEGSKQIPLIEIKDLTYFHQGNARPSLSHINLLIHPGRKIGISGSVGSGKSTLLSCIARMEAVSPNTIFFDNTDVTTLPLTEVRSHLAFVPQESFLFSRTVEENILYGSHLSEEVDCSTFAHDAAQMANVEKDIQFFPNGYATILGERGVNISGGQRQRLTIARAIARKPKILLLDDCMSAIDAETEKKLIENILTVSQGITLVVASHRASTLEQMDWVVCLDNGKIVEQGPPLDLLRNGTHFHKISQKEQMEGANLL